jgi:hypothetical protein
MAITIRSTNSWDVTYQSDKSLLILWRGTMHLPLGFKSKLSIQYAYSLNAVLYRTGKQK